MVEFPDWIARVEQITCFLVILFNVSLAFLALSNSDITRGKGIAHSGFLTCLLACALLIVSLAERAFRLSNGPFELLGTLLLLAMTVSVAAKMHRTN
jgi:hypothetical protein